MYQSGKVLLGQFSFLGRVQTFPRFNLQIFQVANQPLNPCLQSLLMLK